MLFMKKLLNKYQDLSPQVKSSFWFLICVVLQKGISTITTPIFTRLFTTAEYGQYNVFNSWMGIIAVFVTLNLYQGMYSQGIVKFSEDRDVFSSAMQSLLTMLILVSIIVYAVSKDFWNNLFSLSVIQMLAMFFMLWSEGLFNFWSIGQRVNLQYKKLVLLTLITSIVKPIVGIIFVSVAEDKVTARIVGLALVDAAAFSGLYFIQMRKKNVFFHKSYWKYALCFCIPLIPHYLSTVILNSSDRIMIQEIVGDTEAGIYSLAYSISLLMTMLNTALLQTIDPWLYKKIKSKEIDSISVIAYPIWIMVAAANLFLMMLAPEIVAFFAPPEYYDAIWVIPPIAMSVFFMFSYNFFASFAFYFERTKLVAVATTLGALLNIVLNYIFINKFGYYAAGYTTLICYIVYSIAHYFLMRRICREQFAGKYPYSGKIFWGIAAVFMIIGFAILRLYRLPYLRYGIIAVCCIIVILYRNKLKRFLQDILSIRKQ